MFAKDNQTVTTKAASDDAQVLPSSGLSTPFQLLFQSRRRRSVSHPLTTSASQEEKAVSHRGFVPGVTFDRNEYDLRDTGLPGFGGLRHNSITKSSSEGAELARHADCNSEPEQDALRP